MPLAPLGRRLFSLAYETLLLVALLWAAALVYTMVERELGFVHTRRLFQVYLVLVAGIYFVWQWVIGGQTLAMKTWRLKLRARAGGALSVPQAIARYFLALAGTLAVGITYLWAVVDPDRQFLHDRLGGTRVIAVPATTSSSAQSPEKPPSA